VEPMAAGSATAGGGGRGTAGKASTARHEGSAAATRTTSGTGADEPEAFSLEAFGRVSSERISDLLAIEIQRIEAPNSGP